MKISILKNDAGKLKLRYLEVKKSAEYQQDFEKYKKYLRKMGEYFNPFCEDEKRRIRFFDFMQYKMQLENKWQMRFLVNPDYKVQFKERYSSIRTGSPLAKIIYAFGISNDPNLLSNAKKERKVSKLKLDMDEEIKKFFCFAIITRTRMSYSSLGRIMSVDKNTIRNWVAEVQKWDYKTREKVMLEMRTSKNHSISTDIFDLNPRLLQDFAKIEEIFSISQM